MDDKFFKVENLCFGHLKRPLCLKDVNFVARKNDRVLVLGIDGSGKTSLIKTLSGFEEHFFGTVLLEGKEIRKIPDNEKCISIIFDEPILIESTIDKNLNFVYDVLNLPIPSEDEKLKLLQNFKLNFTLNTKIKALNKSQKFKLCLLRSFIKKPKLLFIDNIFKHGFKKEENRELFEILNLFFEDCLIFISADNKTFVQYKEFFDLFSATKLLYLNNACVYEKKSIQNFGDEIIDLDACLFFDSFDYIEGFCVYQEGDFYLSFNDCYVIKVDKNFYSKFRQLKLNEGENEDIILVFNKRINVDLSKNNDINQMFSEKKLMLFSKLDRSRLI